MLRRCAEEVLVGLGPPQIQVREMLPGVPDTAVQLDHLGGVLQRRIATCRRRDQHGELRVGRTGGQLLDRIPRAAGAQFGAHRGVGETMLERLKSADLTAELPAIQQIPPSELDALLGEHRLLGGQQGRRAQPHRGQHGRGRAGDTDRAARGANQPEVGQRPGGVQGGQPLAVHLVTAFHREKRWATVGVGGHQHHVRVGAVGDVVEVATDHPALPCAFGTADAVGDRGGQLASGDAG